MKTSEVFRVSNYKEAIKFIVDEKKRTGEKITYQQIAESIGIQKSYLSQVLNGKAELSSDQMYLFCHFLQLEDEVTEFLNLLLEYSRSGVHAHKEYLKKKINKAKDSNLEISHHLEAPSVPTPKRLNDYYLNPYIQKVHFGLGIHKFSKKPQKLREELNLSHESYAKILQYLENQDLIQQEEKGYKVLHQDWHIDKNSPIYKSWIHQERILGTQRVHQVPLSEFEGFNVTFTADDTTKKEIKYQFLNFLKKVEKIVKKAPPERLYQMGFDLIPWTER